MEFTWRGGNPGVFERHLGEVILVRGKSRTVGRHLGGLILFMGNSRTAEKAFEWSLLGEGEIQEFWRGI